MKQSKRTMRTQEEILIELQNTMVQTQNALCYLAHEVAKTTEALNLYFKELTKDSCTDVSILLEANYLLNGLNSCIDEYTRRKLLHKAICTTLGKKNEKSVLENESQILREYLIQKELDPVQVESIIEYAIAASPYSSKEVYGMLQGV